MLAKDFLGPSIFAFSVSFYSPVSLLCSVTITMSHRVERVSNSVLYHGDRSGKGDQLPSHSDFFRISAFCSKDAIKLY